MEDRTNDINIEQGILPKKRHGCVFAILLVNMILCCIYSLVLIFGGIMNFIANRSLSGGIFDHPYMPVIIISCFLGLITCLMSLYWKRIGIYGLVLSWSILPIYELIKNASFYLLFILLVMVSLLYFTLRLKNKDGNTTWQHFI